jgi:hypothetical protein
MQLNGKGLVGFFDYAASKGLMGRNWADTLKGGCKAVLSAVEPDGWEAIDLDGLDVDLFIERFERLRMGELKPDSLKVYGKRFRIALGLYREFLTSPSTWRYTSGRSADDSSRDRKRTPKGDAAPQRATKDQPTPVTLLLGGQTSEDLISYPYPLRPGRVVTFALPPDLSQKEADRLSLFLRALAVDEQRALPPGRTTEQAS